MSDLTLHSTRHRQAPPGAETYRRDNPAAHVELLDTGHFALETHVDHIAARIREVFDRGP